MKRSSRLLTPAILLVAFSAFQFFGSVRAGAPRRLPGSIIKTDEAVAISEVIIVGKVITFGAEGAIGPGERELFGNRVRVSQDLKGSFDEGSKVTFRQMTESEQMPGTKSFCIFFIEKNASRQHDPFAVLKVWPATKENIAAVRKLISN